MFNDRIKIIGSGKLHNAVTFNNIPYGIQPERNPNCFPSFKTLQDDSYRNWKTANQAGNESN